MKQFSPKRLVLVDGWMNRWMDSWTNGLIGGGMNKWTDEWTAPPHVQTTALQLESLCALVRPKSWFTSVYWRSNGWPSLICRLTEPLTTQSSVICVRTINTSGQDGRPPWPTPWPSPGEYVQPVKNTWCPFMSVSPGPLSSKYKYWNTL